MFNYSAGFVCNAFERLSHCLAIAAIKEASLMFDKSDSSKIGNLQLTYCVPRGHGGRRLKGLWRE
jgi:hypothetical protein